MNSFGTADFVMFEFAGNSVFKMAGSLSNGSKG